MNFNRFQTNRLPGDSLAFRQMEWRTWYEGVQERIANFYSQWLRSHTSHGRFWAALDANERAEQVHVPIASDIAQASSNMLFGAAMELDAGDNQSRIEDIAGWNKLERRLAHAAEIAAAMGGVYLKLDSSEGVDVPVLSVRNPDDTEGTFHVNGDLRNVVFSRAFTEGDESYVLFETRAMEGDDLIIRYQLHNILAAGSLGRQIRLDQAEETSGLEPEIRAQGFGGLGAVYIPNILPNKLFLESHEGVSDYALAIPLMDALDEVYSSWINDVTLGRGRVFIDEELLNTDDDSRRFDPYQRAMTKVQMTNTGDSDKMPIEQVQFAIRAEGHRQTAQDLAERIVSMSGYAPQSFGLQTDGRAPESGTALRLKERKSTATRSKKAWYWKYGLQQLFFEAQRMDNLFLGRDYTATPVSVELAETHIPDRKEDSEVAQELRRADAASTERIVEIVNPGMDESERAEEVERIHREMGEPVDTGA